MNLIYARDPLAEYQLNEFGLKWEVQEHPLQKWDREQSLLTNARVGPEQHLIETSVHDLMQCIEDHRPMLMGVYQLQGDSFLCLSGNHRTEAASRHGVKTIKGYFLMNPDPGMVEEFTRVANCLPVAGLTRDQKLVQADYMVNTRGKTIAQTASDLCVSVKWLAEQMRIQEVANRLECMGINTSRMQKSLLKKLSAVCGKNDNNLACVGRMLLQCGSTVESDEIFLENLKECSSESEFTRQVQKEQQRRIAEHPEVGKNGYVKRRRYPRGSIILSLVTKLHNAVMGVKNSDGMQLTVQESKNVCTKLREVVNRVKEVQHTEPARNG